MRRFLFAYQAQLSLSHSTHAIDRYAAKILRTLIIRNGRERPGNRLGMTDAFTKSQMAGVPYQI